MAGDETNGFNFPRIDQRVTIVGRTGSGKTQKGAWLLSHAPFDRQPYVIVDFKRDKLLNSTAVIREIGLHEKLTRKPGLFIVHPTIDQGPEVEDWLKRIWAHERMGIYIDEGYMIDSRSAALDALYTQGRSKQIPIISLSQRPSWVNRFMISEADFYSVFHLNDRKDQARVREFTPKGFMDVKVEKYHSRWYDVAVDRAFLMKPVPDADEILDRIEDRLRIRRKTVKEGNTTWRSAWTSISRRTTSSQSA